MTNYTVKFVPSFTAYGEPLREAGVAIITCSGCGRISSVSYAKLGDKCDGLPHYCPYCGAKFTENAGK
jgi:hypothetical protein